MKLMTPLQRLVWALIVKETTLNSVATYTVLSQSLSYSRSRLYDIIRGLEKKGYVKRTPGRNNSLIATHPELPFVARIKPSG